MVLFTRIHQLSNWLSFIPQGERYVFLFTLLVLPKFHNDQRRYLTRIEHAMHGFMRRSSPPTVKAQGRSQPSDVRGFREVTAYNRIIVERREFPCSSQISPYMSRVISGMNTETSNHFVESEKVLYTFNCSWLAPNIKEEPLLWKI